ncbi:MAG: EthD domain-containing protein [Acidimicrobiales bacterium]
MIKLTFCLRRRPDLTREEFQAYWLGTHAGLVAERAETLRVRRYVQLHTEDLPGLHQAFQARNGGAPEPYDGIAELWFDSVDDIGGGDDAVARAAAELLADERNFIDLENSPMWLATEHEIVGPTG